MEQVEVKHELKHCPRCGRVFECKVGSINLCQCAGVVLDDEERAYMRSLFHDCLCAGCMEEVKEEFRGKGRKI